MLQRGNHTIEDKEKSFVFFVVINNKITWVNDIET